MKYIAIFDDSMLSNFRLDDENRLTLVLTDKDNFTRAVRLKPIIRPVLTVTEDCGGSATNSVYLTEGHIDAMRKYEEIKTTKEVLDKQISRCLKLSRRLKMKREEAENDKN